MRKMSGMKTAAVLAVATAMLAGCGVFKGGGGPKTPVVGNRVSILSSEKGVVVDPELADVAVSIPEAVVNTDWSQPGGSPSKAIGHVALSGSPSKIWSASIAGSSPQQRLASAPVIADGVLYVIGTDARVSALDAATGARRWTADVRAEGKDAAKAGFGGGVSIVGDRLFVTTGVGDVAALNASNGSQVWKVRPGGPLRGAPTVAFGQVYVMSQDNQIFALSQTDGKTEWTASGTLQSTGVFGVAAPSAGQGTVIAGYSSGELTAYRYENGREIWADALSRTSISTAVASLTDIDANPVIDRGRVFAIGQGGRMASYELTTGQRVWEINIAGISTPWTAGEWVFVVTDDAKLLCVARGTGRIRWISQLRRFKVEKEKKKKGAIRWSGPVLAGGQLYVVSSLGEMLTVNPANGSINAERDIGDAVTVAPVVANNVMYMLHDNGRLEAFR